MRTLLHLPMIALALLAPAVRAAAQEPTDRDVVLNADFVWGRLFRHHADNPVVVTIDNPGPTIEGTLILRWGLSLARQSLADLTPEKLEGASSWTELPVTIPEKSRRRYYVTVRTSDAEGLYCFLRSGDTLRQAFPVIGVQVKEGRALVATVGSPTTLGLPAREAVTGTTRADELPDEWYGYMPLRALVWLGADAGTVRDASVATAIRQWVAAGGHLVIARADTIGFAGTFLESLAPAKPVGTEAVTDWSALGRLAGVLPPEGEGPALVLRPLRGTVIAGTANRPLAVRHRFGRGLITQLAFNPAAPPFDTWASSGTFWRWLLDIRAPGEAESRDRDFYDRSMYAGVNALGSSYLQSALQSQVQTPLPDLWWAFALLLLYLLLIGPVDYIVLRSVRRLELTWITFPLIVAGFSALAVVAGVTAADRATLASEIAVLDVAPDAGTVHGRGAGSLVAALQMRCSVEVAKPHAVVSPQSVGYGFERRDVRVRGPRIEDWTFTPGGQAHVLHQWCEDATPLNAELVGRTLRVANDTGVALAGGLFFSGGRAWALRGALPAGVSEHDLEALKDGEWRAGLVRLAGGAPRPDDDPWNRRNSSGSARHEDDLRRLHLAAGVWWGFAGASGVQSARGLAADLDATKEITSESVLLAWTHEQSRLKYEGVNPRVTTTTIYRVFLPHD